MNFYTKVLARFAATKGLKLTLTVEVPQDDGASEQKVEETKVALREAVRDLVPREILTRRKMGFPVPVGRWLRGHFWPLVEDLVLGPRALQRGFFNPAALQQLAMEHRQGLREHGDRLWLLLNLEIWQRIFLDGDDVGTALTVGA